MLRSHTSLGSISAAVALTLALPFAANAQAPATATPPPAEERGGIEEIIVTAQRREQSAQDVPLAVTAISTELQTSSIRDLRDLNGFAPNVRIDRDPARANGAAITIRGISPTRTDDNSFDSPIAVMIDDIFLGSLSGQVLENFDIQQVEILRGPQGTLFGKNTVGGVLNVKRTVPTGDWGARLKFTAGSFEQREYRAVINAPIVDERLAAKFFFTKISDDGWIKNTTLGRGVAQKDYMNYGVTLLATPTDRIRALFTIERFDDETEGGASLTNFNLGAGVVPAPPPGSNEPDLSVGFRSCSSAAGNFATGVPFGHNSGPLPGVVDPTGTVLQSGVPCRTSTKIPKKVSGDVANPASLTTNAYTLDTSFELDDNMRVVSVFGYREMTEDRLLDFDGTSANYITIDRENDFDQLSEEIRFHGDWDRVHLAAGYYYWNSEFTQDWVTGGSFWTNVLAQGGVDLANNQWINGAVLPPPLALCQAGAFGALRCDDGIDGTTAGSGLGANFTQVLFETQETTSHAVFGSVDWEFVENWTVTLGLRWTKETKDFRAAQSYLTSVARSRLRNFPDFADLDRTWTDTSPKVALAWEPTDDILLFASYSEGFHSGGFFGVNQNVADFERDQYDPEFARSYELGAKSQWFDNRVQLNGSFFYNQFRNKQESAVQIDPTTNTVATVFANVADAVYQGIDLELQVAPVDQLSLFAAFGWLDAEYRDFFTDINSNDTATTTLANCPGTFVPSTPGDIAIGQCIQDASFLQPRNAAKYTVGVGGTVRQEIGGGTAEASLKYNWLSEVETSLLNLSVGRLDSRADLQLTAGYRYENVAVTFFARNLTNEQFETPFLIEPLFASGTIVPGRTYGVDVTIELGSD